MNYDKVPDLLEAESVRCLCCGIIRTFGEANGITGFSRCCSVIYICLQRHLNLEQLPMQLFMEARALAQSTKPTDADMDYTIGLAARVIESAAECLKRGGEKECERN